MTKLIAIAGSQGVGKSTTIAECVRDFSPTVVERKTSRSILSDWGVTLNEVNSKPSLTVRFQEEILTRKLQDERAYTDHNPVVITERTYADLFVYAVMALGSNNLFSNWLNEYYHRCADAQRSYNGVVYLTAGHFQPADDSVRATNQHYSRIVDDVMSQYTKLLCQSASVDLKIVDTAWQPTRVHVVQTLCTNQE